MNNNNQQGQSKQGQSETINSLMARIQNTNQSQPRHAQGQPNLQTQGQVLGQGKTQGQSQGQSQTSANTVQNQSMQNEQPTSKMSDRDYLTDILSTEKYLTDGLNVMVREASNDELFRVEFGILQDTHQSARTAFNLMFRKGWYKLESAQAQKISQTVQKSTQQATEQFPFH